VRPLLQEAYNHNIFTITN